MSNTYGSRTPIAGRNDIDFNQRKGGSRFRRRLGRSYLWGIIAPLVLLAIGWFGYYGVTMATQETPEPPRFIFTAGPLTKYHEQYTNQCNKCHSQTGAPLWRMVTFSNDYHSVEDNDCRSCHKHRNTDDHSKVMVMDDISGCVTCHKEHQHRRNLADVGQALCAECHGDLHTTRPGSATVFTPHLSSLADHPEFAVVRFSEEQPPEAEQLDPDHDAAQLIALVDGKWRDAARTKFNHQSHLDPKGKRQVDSDELRVLKCADCHKPQGEQGAYMTPVTYEENCASCHKLDVIQEAFLDDPPFELPHEKFKQVGALVHKRLIEFYSKGGAAEGDPRLDPRLPTPSPIPGRDADPATTAQVAEEMEAVAKFLLTERCAFCHTAGPAPKEPTGPFDRAMLSPNLPTRWMPHSRFDHSKHKTYECNVCHDPRYLETHNKPLQVGDSESVQLSSTSSGDILMPSIAVCRKCHTNSASGGEWGVTASGNCIECHSYHHDER